MSYFFGLETNGLNKLYIYEGHMEAGVVKVGDGDITVKYDCILTSRLISYKGEDLQKIEKMVNYQYWCKENLTGYFNNYSVEHSVIKIEDSIAKDIIRYIEEVEPEDQSIYIKTKCENLLQLPPGEFSHELTKILGHIEDSMDIVFQSKAYKLLNDTVQAYKSNKLKIAQETNEPVLIYNNVEPIMYGERGYLNKREYVYPDGHTEKKEQYTNG